MDQKSIINPDSRGRLALGSLVDKNRSYNASVGDHGVVTLVPVGAVLSDEQVQDLQADPKGFAEMLARAESVAKGETSTVSAIDFLDGI